MAANTLTTFNKGLKTFFRDKVSNDIPEESPFLSMLEDKTSRVRVGGRSLTATWAIRKKRGWGTSALSEGGDFATAQPMEYENYVVGLSHLNAALELTGHLRAAGSSKDMTFIEDIFEELREQTVGIIRRLIGIYAWGDGTGILAQVSAVNSNVLTLTGTNIEWFEKGMILTCRDLTTGGTEQFTAGSGSAQEITAVDYENGTITMADASGAAVNDYLALDGYYDQTVLTGLRKLVDNAGTVQNINRATAGNDFAQAWEVSAGGAALSEYWVQQLQTRLTKFSRSKRSAQCYITDPDTETWMYLAQVGRHRYSDNSNMAAGVDGLRINTASGPVELKTDPCAYPGELYAMNLDEFGFVRPTTGDASNWVQNGDSVIFQKNASSGQGHADAQVAYWVERLQLLCDDFRAQGKLTTYVSP